MSEPVAIEKRGPVTTIILNRPHVRNAVDRDTAETLAEAFVAFEHDSAASVAVLWGAGGTFCSGADLGALARGAGHRLESPRRGEPLDRSAPLGPTRLELSKPVIAAIAGHAVAGGLELALWCDLRVAEDDAVLGVYCRRFGVPLIDGGTVRLPRLIGQGRALDLILTGRAVSATEALAMGLVTRVVPKGGARLAAEQLAQEIAQHPQACMRNDRRSVYEQWDLSLTDALRREFEFGMASLASGEAVSGARQFVAGKGRGGRPIEA